MNNKFYVGRGFLHPEKLKIAEKLRGKPLVDAENAEEHKGVAEIRLVPYMYYCYLAGEMGYARMRNREYSIREQWEKEGILTGSGYPNFTPKGKRFAEYVLKWAYPEDYARMVLEGRP